MDNEFPLVIGLGEILWDIYNEGKQLGGAPANFAYHARQLGADAYVVSRVGADTLGREIISKLDQLKLKREYVRTDKTHPTGTVTVKLDGRRQPSYVIHEDTAWDNIIYDDRLKELAAKANAICFGSLCQRSRVSRETIRELVKSVPADCFKIFDINLRQMYYNKEVIFDSLENANIFKLNDQELPVIAAMISQEGSEEAVFERLFSLFPLKLIALTCGGKGSKLVTPKSISIHPGFPASIVDTVGAGDAFTAAITMGLFRNYDLDGINSFANRIASYVCTCQGGTPEIPRELLYPV